MSLIQLEEDLYIPHPSGLRRRKRFIGLKGSYIDEALYKECLRLNDPDSEPSVDSAEDQASEVEGEDAESESVQPAPASDLDELMQVSDYPQLTVTELHSVLEHRGVEFPVKAKKSELIAILEQADNQE